MPANHPLRPIRTGLNDALAKMDTKFSAMYEADIKGGRSSIQRRALQHCAREADARPATAGAVQRAQRAPTGRADSIQPAVPLVRGPGHRRHGVEPICAQQKPRQADRARRGYRTVQCNGGDGRAARAALGRALQRGRHADPGLGSHKSMRRKDGSDDGRPPENWHGEPRNNATRESKSDPESRCTA